MNSEHFIQIQLENTMQIMNRVEKLKGLEMSVLGWKEKESSWNILECLEHLNLYGDFYLPQIENKIKSAKTEFETEFKSGVLGNYFATSMLPKEKLNKMKTFKDKNPLNSNLNKSTFDEFMKQQLQLLELLNLSRNVSLNKVKIKTSISSLIQLRLGDTFRFLINHNFRHLQQIENIQQKMI